MYGDEKRIILLAKSRSWKWRKPVQVPGTQRRQGTIAHIYHKHTRYWLDSLREHLYLLPSLAPKPDPYFPKTRTLSLLPTFFLLPNLIQTKPSISVSGLASTIVPDWWKHQPTILLPGLAPTSGSYSYFRILLLLPGLACLLSGHPKGMSYPPSRSISGGRLGRAYSPVHQLLAWLFLQQLKVRTGNHILNHGIRRDRFLLPLGTHLPNLLEACAFIRENQHHVRWWGLSFPKASASSIQF